jgi:hypothetical protein
MLAVWGAVLLRASSVIAAVWGASRDRTKMMLAVWGAVLVWSTTAIVASWGAVLV